MRKTIYTLCVNDFAPDITAITFPRLQAYADRIGAEFVVIAERKYPDWPVTYEKLQVHRLMAERDDDWSIFLDADTLLHPDLPDMTLLLPPDTVAHNGTDPAFARWTYDEYFHRDGRHISSCTWMVICPRWCRDLWRPLDDLTLTDALARIRVIEMERMAGMQGEHLIDDYTLSRNIARYGLKVREMRQVWPSVGIAEHGYYWHIYATPEAEKLKQMREVLERWSKVE